LGLRAEVGALARFNCADGGTRSNRAAALLPFGAMIAAAVPTAAAPVAARPMAGSGVALLTTLRAGGRAAGGIAVGTPITAERAAVLATALAVRSGAALVALAAGETLTATAAAPTTAPMAVVAAFATARPIVTATEIAGGG